MIEKWAIIEPDKDKKGDKAKLILKCDLKDILSIVKKIGASCSRPERIVYSDYNFIIYLLDYNEDVLNNLKSAIETVNNKAKLKEAQKVKKGEVKVEAKKEEIEIPVPEIPLPEVNKTQEEKINEKPVASTDIQSNEQKQEVLQKEPEKDKKDISDRTLPKFGPAIPKAQSVRIRREDLVKEEKKEEEKKKEEPKITQTSLQKEKIKLRWSIELPLNPTLSFQTLITSSHNRFAHAASMAVVENPGVMYNPLLIYGYIGSGKSHFIHSISYGLSSTIGQKNIFVTNGIKFSLGVDLAIKQGFIESLEKIIDECKVIIIDDVHLMMINKENRPFISKILSSAMNSNKQVVFSSLLSPSELEPLENMLGIQFSVGWMVDIKQPDPKTYRMILDQILSGMDVKLSEEQIKNIFVIKSMDFQTVNKNLFRLKKLEKYLSAMDPSLLHYDMLSMIVGIKDDMSAPSEDEIIKTSFMHYSGDDVFYRWGIFYPKGMKIYINYVLSKLSGVILNKLGIDLKWKTEFMEEYDPDEVYGIPFKIGSYVTDRSVNGVILIGPPPTSALSSKEKEFSHITEKVLQSMNIKLGWVSLNKLKAESSYLSTALDLI